MDVVTELVIAPFRDIVDKGKTAVDNAGDSQHMLQAARALVKEGERALKRIEPLCKKHLDEYGSSFVDALKENDDISTYRSELTDLLWEFDDYIEADGFDSDKYAQVQGLSRKAAPRIYDILMRMKLEARPRDNTQFFLSQLSPPSSPLPLPASLQPPPLHPATGLHYPQAILPPPTRGSLSSAQAGSPADFNTVADATSQLQRLIYSRDSSSLDDVPEVLRPARAPKPEPEPAPVEQPPRPPSTNPWDPQVAPLFDDGRSGEYSPIERRPVVYRPESPVDPAISPLSPQRERKASSVGRRPVTSLSGGSDYDSDDRRQSSSSAYSSNSAPYSSRTRASNLTTPIPEEELVERATKPLPQLPPPRYSPVLSYSQRSSIMPHWMTGESTAGSGDVGGHHQLIVVRNGPASENPPPVPPIPRNFALQNNEPRPPTSAPQDQPGLEIPPPIMPTTEIDTGLIPVEPETTNSASPESHGRLNDCNITSASSFYHHKGFCEGAKEVIRGDIGIKKTQKPVRRTLSRVVARCTGCLYELDFGQIEIDVNKQDDGNFTKNNVGYRLRFLQKSHLPAKRVDDVLYACVFCVHQGRTLDESDATVFFTTKALFSHLARHPRPLPDVPGICVVDQVEVPDHLRNDYDLHFTHPPTAHPAQENGAEVAGHPTGVAKEQARRIYGQRLLYDRTVALELAQGARITGIKWPPKYNGEWIFAWHDGVFASVPADVIKLNLPPAAEIKLGGTSHIRARSKWKFAPKDKEKENWLKFDKNELITNISWAHPEHWCWSGTNAKGKWGIFPQAFIDPNTVQELTADSFSDRASSLSHEKTKSSSSMLSKFSVRRPSGRPPSIAESTSSRETGHPSLRLNSRGSR
ncbi:hypothetical protein TOPH_06580 [Tolypocladium ophioglossoides CBS 100239]|uniref:SH3 domain-containing protein n=1 Tax=Tolypocladium ophioglossoides (strain CBS 100239) TaxID=1163406 RepID=A0A0L0N403_TOLOC|nr:hypothetical protein TOPH_06580 [Tolypocladium ophioglossoides CBS 100239]